MASLDNVPGASDDLDMLEEPTSSPEHTLSPEPGSSSTAERDRHRAERAARNAASQAGGHEEEFNYWGAVPERKRRTRATDGSQTTDWPRTSTRRDEADDGWPRIPGWRDGSSAAAGDESGDDVDQRRAARHTSRWDRTDLEAVGAQGDRQEDRFATSNIPSALLHRVRDDAPSVGGTDQTRSSYPVSLDAGELPAADDFSAEARRRRREARLAGATASFSLRDDEPVRANARRAESRTPSDQLLDEHVVVRERPSAGSERRGESMTARHAAVGAAAPLQETDMGRAPEPAPRIPTSTDALRAKLPELDEPDAPRVRPTAVPGVADAPRQEGVRADVVQTGAPARPATPRARFFTSDAREARIAELRNRMAEATKRRERFCAQLGSSLYEATRENPILRMGREELYDGIAQCDAEREAFQRRIDEIGAEEQAARAASQGYECPRCHFKLNAQDRFCSGCGLPIAEVIAGQASLQPAGNHANPHCPTCGGVVNEEDAFSMHCGAALK